ncbi:MAG: SCP2 sterol-binding domain-containing protein [Proteobacteria bacterium]|nr:SCP2 sterol-binding domain-containing protein [Pseudomonadota bacterium]
MDEILDDPKASVSAPRAPIDAKWLKKLCMDCGAEDVGFVELERPSLADQLVDIKNAFGSTRSLISFVIRMNRDNIRSPKRSIANVDFHHTGDDVLDTARHIVKKLRDTGIGAVYPAMGFPMEMDQFPGKTWVISHKPVAIEAGLGHMGIHRNLIHPRYGNFVLLGSILLDSEISSYNHPIDYNPCLECKLCVAACPVGAIGPDGHFDFAACYNHNYTEFMGGFTAFTEKIADAKDSKALRQTVTDSESASWWQSLSFGANYKAAYCLAVCPAGDDVIGPYLANKAEFKQDVLKPLVDKEENIYVVPGSDAHDYVKKRFKHKTPRLMRSHLRPTSIAGFVRSLPLVFNRHRSKGISARYHFIFEGTEKMKTTVEIKDKQITVLDGLVDTADIQVTADSKAWLSFLRKDKNLALLILTRKIRLKGSPKFMKLFARCFR